MIKDLLDQIKANQAKNAALVHQLERLLAPLFASSTGAITIPPARAPKAYAKVPDSINAKILAMSGSSARVISEKLGVSATHVTRVRIKAKKAGKSAT